MRFVCHFVAAAFKRTPRALHARAHTPTTHRPVRSTLLAVISSFICYRLSRPVRSSPSSRAALRSTSRAAIFITARIPDCYGLLDRTPLVCLTTTLTFADHSPRSTKKTAGTLPAALLALDCRRANSDCAPLKFGCGSGFQDAQQRRFR